MSFLVLLGLTVLDLDPMYATDRQKDARHCLMPANLGAMHNNGIAYTALCGKNYEVWSWSRAWPPNLQETQLSLTNHVMHLCKCNGLADLKTTLPIIDHEPAVIDPATPMGEADNVGCIAQWTTYENPLVA